jgi:hypothetical protein
VLVTLVLILLAQLDDLFDHLHVKALTLGLGEDLLLSLGELLELSFDLLDAMPTPSLMASPLLCMDRHYPARE